MDRKMAKITREMKTAGRDIKSGKKMELAIIKENLKKHSSESIQGLMWAQRYINYWKMKQLEKLEVQNGS